MGLIRFSLALIVVLFHTGSNVGGPFAVYAFYVISGYVMTAALESHYQSRIFRFFLNRIWRLIPLYILSVVMIWGSARLVISNSHLKPENLPLVGQKLLASANPISGLVRGSLPDWNIKWDGHPILVAFFQWNNPYWTVIIEMLFYLLVPSIVWFQRPNRLIRSIYFFVLALITYIFYADLGSYDLTDLNRFIYRKFFPTLVFFSLGNLAFRLKAQCKFPFLQKLHFFIGSTLLIYLLFFTSKRVIPSSVTLNWMATQWITAILTFLCILGIGSKKRSAHKYLEYLGSLSYPIYVMQGFVINLPMYYFLLTNESKYPPAKELYWYGEWNRLEIDLYSLSFSILVATLLVRFVDKPISKWRHNSQASISNSER